MVERLDLIGKKVWAGLFLLSSAFVILMIVFTLEPK